MWRYSSAWSCPGSEEVQLLAAGRLAADLLLCSTGLLRAPSLPNAHSLPAFHTRMSLTSVSTRDGTVCWTSWLGCQAIGVPATREQSHRGVRAAGVFQRLRVPWQAVPRVGLVPKHRQRYRLRARSRSRFD